MSPTRDAPDIEVVLFDLGGVLVELGGMGDMVAFADEPDEDEIWRRWLACPWVRRYERGECDSHAFARGVVEAWSMPVAPEVFLRAFVAWPRGLLSGARELLGELAGRHRVACLSNTNDAHKARFDSEFALFDHFDAAYLSHEIGLVKPDRAAFEHTVADLACDPARVLFLDDNQINVEGARAAGLRAEKAVGPAAARAVLTRYALLPDAS